MVILAFIIILLAIFIIIMFAEPVRISFLLDTDRLEMSAKGRWTAIAAFEARIIDYRLFVTVRLFGWKIFTGFLKKTGSKRPVSSVFQALALSDTSVEIAWGLNAPHLTGIFCAAAEFAGRLLRDADIALEPDFVPDREYLHLTAKTSLNLGKTVVNMLRVSRAKRRKGYGSAA